MDKKKIANEKRKITKANNEKKIIQLFGYEIWRDPLNYTVIKNGNNSYFSTYQNALKEIRDELIRNKLAGSETLEHSIKTIQKIDKDFLNALPKAVANLGRK